MQIEITSPTEKKKIVGHLEYGVFSKYVEDGSSVVNGNNSIGLDLYSFTNIIFQKAVVIIIKDTVSNKKYITVPKRFVEHGKIEHFTSPNRSQIFLELKYWKIINDNVETDVQKQNIPNNPFVGISGYNK